MRGIGSVRAATTIEWVDSDVTGPGEAIYEWRGVEWGTAVSQFQTLKYFQSNVASPQCANSITKEGSSNILIYNIINKIY